MKNIEWGEFKLGDLFFVESYKKRFDANKVKILTEGGGHPYIVRQGSNNGQKGYIDEDEKFLNEGNTISFGQDTATMFYQEEPYFTGDKIKILKPKLQRFSKKNAQFFLVAMRMAFLNFGWGQSKFDIKTLEKQIIYLPVRNEQIDFDFMEYFIAELEAERVQELAAYLEATGLTDYTLTKKEKSILGGGICPNKWKKVSFISIFNQIHQGRRLKKEDQLPGAIPFVMSGTTNNGVVGYISNPVASFPANSITMDIFGNTFYRNYEFGAGDDTGVYWSDKVSYSLGTMLFFTTVMRKAVEGRFSYGKKLRSSKSLEIKMYVPINNNELDYDYMETLISAVQKLVIRDVVIYTKRKLNITKQVVFGKN